MFLEGSLENVVIDSHAYSNCLVTTVWGERVRAVG